MKHPLCNSSILVLVSLAMLALPVLSAEPHCPGRTASVTPRFVQRALIVIPVKINDAGPFDFMVDTGSQITVVDPSLALELGLKSQGTVGLVSVAKSAQASVAVVDRLEAASLVVEKPFVVVQDLGQIQVADARIRGVLGENFLAHFDVLIDYEKKLLCVDETGVLRESVRGERIPFVAPQHPENEVPFLERLVVPVQLSGSGSRQILLQLDSGADGPILYAHSKERELPILAHAALQGRNASRAQQAFAVLPGQDVHIGGRTLSNVSFVTPVSVARDLPSAEEDGLLPALLFQRVFISGAGHYVIFEPR